MDRRASRRGWGIAVIAHPAEMSRNHRYGLPTRKGINSRVSIFNIVGCHHAVPKLTEAAVERLRNELPGVTEECLSKMRFGGVEAIPKRVDQCFKMTPAQRWRGLWRDDFEGQQFCPAPARQCSFDSPDDRIWLTFGTDVHHLHKTDEGSLYTIDFVGRRTLLRGLHGHMGVFQHEIVVDKLISIRSINDGPPSD